jgi:thiosulfate/3-mercaptopyruvate sulfurtransferase
MGVLPAAQLPARIRVGLIGRRLRATLSARMSPESRNGSTVDVDWIAAHLGDPGVRLVEIDVSRAAYEEGHIPGAVLWNAYSDLRDANYKPVGLAEIGRLLMRSGITPDTCVVTYGYGAPLGFWLLRAHGHEDVRMLMGPREQWAQMGHRWSTDVPAVAESAHRPVVANDSLLASREAVTSAINDASQLVLDLRAEGEYDGEFFWPSGATEDTGRTGHVPGAVNVPIGLLRAEDGTLRSADELRSVFERAGVTKDKALITYCTIGNRASEAWFALKYVLDYPDVRVYYGSWVEWGKATDTPIET